MNKDNFKRIDYQNLLLDKENPRLPKLLTESKSSGEEFKKEIIDFFLRDESLVELMLAIGTNDFFEGEPLLVIKADNDKYTVIEGNRRLAAIQLLHYPELAEIYKSKVRQVIDETRYRPEKIPCFVFNDREEIYKYLGFVHITGKKSWGVLQKVRYSFHLKEKFYPKKTIGEASREIAKMIGSRKDYVTRLLSGYELYKNVENNGFYKIRDLDEIYFGSHFTYILDSLRHSNIAEFLEVDLNKDNPVENFNQKNLKEWTFWFFDKTRSNKIIADSRHLRALNKVLEKNKEALKALKAFKDGKNLFHALEEYTGGIDKQFQNAIDKAIEFLNRADSLSHKVHEFHLNIVDDLDSIFKITRKIKNTKADLESDKNDEL